ncbi:MAG: TonB-dependent receptor, partial [Pseudomonadota bacterium]
LTLLGDLQESASLSILGGASGNIFSDLAQGVSTEGDFAANTFTQSGESISIFTHNVFALTDRIDLTLGLRYVDESKDGAFEQTGGEFDACNAFFQTVAAGAAPPVNLGNVIRLDELTAVINCFVFAAPAYDPANPGAVLGAVAAGPQAYLLDFLPQEFNETFEDDELVYTLKGSFKLNSTTNIYGGFTHGFKSGGFNLDASAAGGGASPQFDSEKVDAWEVGLKTDFFDGRARVNIAAFIQEMEDFQVLEFTGTQFQTFNVGKAESKGVEFEGLAQLTDNFLANLGLTYADAAYPDDCTPLDPSDPDFARNPLTLCGQPLTNAPELVAILGGTYERDVFTNMNFFATGSVRYETERRTSSQPVEAITSLQLANANGLQPGLVGPADTVAEVMTLIASAPELPGDYQDDNTKVNLRIGLESEDGRWTVELWGNNIFDERTKNVTFNIPLRGGFGDRARGQFVQDPATYGVTLRTNF